MTATGRWAVTRCLSGQADNKSPDLSEKNIYIVSFGLLKLSGRREVESRISCVGISHRVGGGKRHLLEDLGLRGEIGSMDGYIADRSTNCARTSPSCLIPGSMYHCIVSHCV